MSVRSMIPVLRHIQLYISIYLRFRRHYMFHQSLHQLDGRPAGISVQLTFEKALVLILSWHLKLVLGRTLVSEPFFSGQGLDSPT